MRKICFVILILISVSLSANAITSNEMLNKVKNLEANFTDFSVTVKGTGDPGTVKNQGNRYEDILQVKDGTIKYKKHNMIRIDGKIQGLKGIVVQNGYWVKMQIGIMNMKRNQQNDPGKRQNSLDMGMLSSILWKDNKVVIMSESNGVAKVKFTPVYGGDEKRCDIVWIDVDSLKLVKREKYNYEGKLKKRFEYKEYKELTSNYYIATKTMAYDEKNKYLATANYSNLKINQKMDDKLFKM